MDIFTGKFKILNGLFHHPDAIALIIAAIWIFTKDFLHLKAATGIEALILASLIYVALRQFLHARKLDSILSLLNSIPKRHCAGISDASTKRSDLFLTEIERDVEHGCELFVLCRTFSAFTKLDVQNKLQICLDKGGRVRIITYSGQCEEIALTMGFGTNADLARREIEHSLTGMKNFRKGLAKHQSKFQFRVLKNKAIPAGLLGNEKRVLVTLYTSISTGNDSPAIMCIPAGNSEPDFYHLYKNMFDYLWDNHAEEAL